MICAAHAILGAAVGSFARTRTRAFLAGVGTHLLGDLLPHRDFTPPMETALVGAALALVGAAAGVDSTAFAGAIGGAAPDFENGLAALALTDRRVFPTHHEIHGRRTAEVWSQVALSAAALAIVAWQVMRTPPHAPWPLGQTSPGVCSILVGMSGRLMGATSPEVTRPRAVF